MDLLAVLGQAAPVETTATGGAAEFWVFWIMAPVALGSALALVLMRNTVHAALMLVLNFFAIAVLYAVLEAQFLAVVQIIVYAGAVMVLFLFVLMLLGVVRDTALGGRLRGAHTVAAVVVGVLIFGVLAVAVAGPYLGPDAVCAPKASGCQGLAGPNSAEGGNVAGLGRLLFTRYVWPFEVTSILLVIAAIGVIVLGRRHEDPAALVDRARETVPATGVDDADEEAGQG